MLDRLRLDPVTFLTSLLAGLLPLTLMIVITVIMYQSVTNLSLPLLNLFDKQQFDLLQVKCRELDQELDRRFVALRQELRARLTSLDDPPPDPRVGTAGWELLAGVRWYPGEGRTFGLDSMGRDTAEAILTALTHETDSSRRRDQIEALSSLPVEIQDPMGFSYGLEAALFLGGETHADLSRTLLFRGALFDPSERRACLRELGGRLTLAELPVPIRPREGASPVAPGETGLTEGDSPELLVGVANPGGGTLVLEFPGEDFLSAGLRALRRGTELRGPEGFLLQRRSDGEGQELSYPVGHPFNNSWELVPIEPAGASAPLELLSRMRGIHHIWFGVAVLIIGVVISVLLAFVVSRRVQLSRRKDDFLRMVSHELRTPIASLRVLVDTLGMGRIRDEKDRLEMLGLLGAETDRLSDLVERVLEYGRTERGRAHVREVITDPGDLVEDAVRIFRERQSDAGEITVRTAQQFHPVVLDREAVMRVVLNLLSNARKFSAETPIEVTVGEESRHLFVEVRDQGPGIRKRDQRRIFRAFYRAPQTAGTAGFGLGLAYCREVAEAHRGKMKVRSAPGQGAAFTLEIPLVHPREGTEHGSRTGR